MKDTTTTLISKSNITRARIARSLALSTVLFTGTFFFYGCGNTNTTAPVTTEDVHTIVNNAPQAITKSFNINRDARYEGQLTATDADGDRLEYVIVDAPLHGSVTLHENGCFTYTPDAGYKGSDTFSYRVYDGTCSSSIKTVTINIDETPDITPAAPDNLTVTALSTTKLELHWNDNADNEEGYLIYQDGKLVASTKANETSKILCSGLKA